MGKPWAAVIGDPIEHSLSPAMHQAAYRWLGIDWDYRRIQVSEEQLPAFIASLGADCRGLSVTMPCKRALLATADVTDSLAKMVHSANTLVRAAGVNAAFNTDVAGIAETLRPVTHSADRSGRPVVIGNGATACSAMAALRTLGWNSVAVVARNLEGHYGAFTVANRMGMDTVGIPLHVAAHVRKLLSAAPIVISTVPPQAVHHLAEDLDLDGPSVLLDVTYAKERRPLVDAFANAGATIANPLMMLVHQGIAQVKLMTDREVPLEPMVEAVDASLLSGLS